MTRASDTAKLLGAGATILDGTTISTADNDAQLTLKSTDADATLGPLIDLVRDSGSPADNDVAGKINFTADNDAGEVTIFADTFVKLTDVSNGTEDATVSFRTITGGSLKEISMGAGNLIFNENGAGVHLGVTSATASNLLDDYEEGTFTPTAANATGYVVQAGHYTKIGNQVTCVFNVEISGVSSNGNTVSGLPFAPSLSSAQSSGYVGVMYYANLANNFISLGGYVIHNNTQVYFSGANSAASTIQYNGVNVWGGSGSRILATVTYLVA